MKAIGIYTEDFRFFYDLVRLLKERGEEFVSLEKAGPVPAGVGVVITTEAEKEKVRFPRVVVQDDPEMAINLAKCILAGGCRYRTVVIGIDPGKSIGLAVFGEGKLLATETVRGVSRLPATLQKLLSCLTFDRSLARIGHGDPTNRNRIIRGIWSLVDEVELVDETGTTSRAVNPDVEAAKRIAMTSGGRVAVAPEVAPTPGEIRDIQRLSRIESEGRVTISTDLAAAVARGEMTLKQAVQAQRRTRAEGD